MAGSKKELLLLIVLGMPSISIADNSQVVTETTKSSSHMPSSKNYNTKKKDPNSLVKSEILLEGTFDDSVIVECYGVGDKRSCFKTKKGVSEKFYKIKGMSEDLYVHSFGFYTKYPSGGSEPEEQGVTIYQKVGQYYSELFELPGYTQCNMLEPEFFEYVHHNKSYLIIRTECHQTGTGHFYDVNWHGYQPGELFSLYVDDSGFGENEGIVFDSKNIGYYGGRFGYSGLVEDNNGNKKSVDITAIEEKGRLYLKPVLADYHSYKENDKYNHEKNYQTGLRYFKDKKYEKAIEYFELSLEYYEASYQYRRDLGLALLKAGRYNESIQQSLLVLDQSKAVFGNAAAPSNKFQSATAYNIGLAYEKLGDWKNAAMYYKKSVDMHKTSARVRAYERVMNELTSKAR